ncbi:MAG: glutamate ABC transporter substrate-binding protein [Acidimicrobiales bacterium]
MRRRGWALLPAIVALSLIAGACGSDSDDSTTNTTSPGTTRPTFAAGTKMADLQAKGKIVIGTKFDQPGFGLKNPTNNEIEGFDVEIGKLIAVGIFGGTINDVGSKIEFKETVSANREPFIENGTVDMVVATYTINDARKLRVGFAGPYFVAEQDIMVKSTDTTIKSVTDLNGKAVCSVKGSTSARNLQAKAPQASLTELDTYSQCAEQLRDNRVVAVTTDNAILAGLVQQSSGQFKLVKAPFSSEPYGIGVSRNDEAFRAFINDQLQTIFTNGQWATAFKNTLGKIGLDTPTPPAIDRYVTGAAAATTTTVRP